MDETSGVYSGVGPRPAVRLRDGDAAAVREALVALRGQTLALADAYAAALGDATPVPHRPDLNPPRWEWGHVAWFQAWWIGRNPHRARGAGADPDVPRPASLLAGADALYDSGRVAHATRWSLPLPDPDGTRRYLDTTLQQTLAALGALPADATADDLYFFRLVALHEAMHAEAAAYMARTLGIASPDRPRVRFAGAPAELALPARRFHQGSGAGGFAFDNELAAHDVDVPAARIDAAPVTWARYLPFVEDGGYEAPRFWDEAGRAWLAQAVPRQPIALRRAPDGGWTSRFNPAGGPPDPEAPAVHLTLHEAKAWCRWAGRALPTEAQWECAALTLPGFRWGGAWEWTASPFVPYEGFRPHPYRDYSAPWFGTRQVLRGAAAATSPWLAHARYRNFFEPHRRDVFAGFRSIAPAPG